MMAKTSSSTDRIHRAIRFAVKTHEIYQKQKRKGVDVPYIVHPLSVGLILASMGASEDLIIAGILHDTIEDSVPEKKVTKEMIQERFGQSVADMVMSVSEEDKSLPWEIRKTKALEHIQTFSNDSVMLKSADVINNLNDRIKEIEDFGDEIFKNFHASKEKLQHMDLKVITTLVNKWPENPLAHDLLDIKSQIEKLNS